MAATGSKDLNTPKILKNLKSYRHIFTRKRDSVKSFQGRKTESASQAKHGIASGLNFFWVTRISPHLDTDPDIGCAVWSDGNDQVKPWQTELRKFHC